VARLSQAFYWRLGRRKDFLQGAWGGNGGFFHGMAKGVFFRLGATVVKFQLQTKTKPFLRKGNKKISNFKIQGSKVPPALLPTLVVGGHLSTNRCGEKRPCFYLFYF